MRRRVMILAACVLSFHCLDAAAQTAQVRQYAAKFVCGRADTPAVTGFNFAPGSYYTVINVHNPALVAAVEFKKKFALAEPNEQGGKISEWFSAALKPDQAMRVDCGSIYKHLGIPPGTFIDGFAVLQLPTTRHLDVVGVYTVSPGPGVSSIHTERVEGRVTQ